MGQRLAIASRFFLRRDWPDGLTQTLNSKSHRGGPRMKRPTTTAPIATSGPLQPLHLSQFAPARSVQEKSHSTIVFKSGVGRFDGQHDGDRDG